MDTSADDTAAAIYTELARPGRPTHCNESARLLTLEGNPAGTRDAVQEALRLLDRAAEQISQLETLDL